MDLAARSFEWARVSSIWGRSTVMYVTAGAPDKCYPV
jgi:hypothetical protein